MNASDIERIPPRPQQGQGPSHQVTLAKLCQRLRDPFAPAAILINRKYDCLYFLGATDRYLRLRPGRPTHDLLAMMSPALRTMLRSAIRRAGRENRPVVVPGGRIKRDGDTLSFSIAVQPVTHEGEKLLFICFLNQPARDHAHDRLETTGDVARVVELEQELEVTRTERKRAIRNLEISKEEQKTINEVALSVNKEYRSTNEQLLASKEKLQSLNEELAALNSQLQETLKRQSTISNDLENVLYSTDVAALFLDTNLNIRLFTPATKSLFRVIPSDIGRPLADLNSLAVDGALLTDARIVLRTLVPIELEIEGQRGAWYIRRISPYRTKEKGVEGVVITFADITARRHAADALEVAKQEAQQANIAKSRFLAAASHDLRQPMQALSFMRDLLARKIKEDKKEEALELVARLDETAASMSGMLDTLLDINQLEAGNVRAEIVNFSINDLLERLKDEFAYHAQAQGLALRMVSCGLVIQSDPRLIERMIRNLLSNALKYTERGKVLLGCRRRGKMLSIEVWDTGVGIPEKELHAIFEGHHQLDNAARERSRGMGLGLAIVQRLAKLLGQNVHVRSQLGKGSAFAIEVAPLPGGTASRFEHHRQGREGGIAEAAHHAAAILIIEDDPELRNLLELLLIDKGHRTAAAPDGVAALELVARGAVRPDLILADYNLPNGMDGLEVALKLRDDLCRQIPVIILTGDISTDTLRDIAQVDCLQLNKPVKSTEVMQAIQRLLPISQTPPSPRASHPAEAAMTPGSPVIFVVDDDSRVRDGIRRLLEAPGRTVEDYATCEAFLEAYRPSPEACLLVDAYLPGMSGLELLQRLRDAGHRLPSIMITGNADVPMAVEAMKAGASDFIEKPIGSSELLAGVERALAQSRDATKLSAWREDAAKRIAGLTRRQRQIMGLVLAGQANKNIAVDLGISQRSVESHRAMIMKKTGSKSLPALTRLALAAASNGVDEPVVHRGLPVAASRGKGGT
jgi:two-component system CheB/CheR fusion protein